MPERRPRPGAQRAVASAATLIAATLAWLVWGSGFDRLGRTAPEIAGRVPPALRSQAWRSDAALALKRDRPRAALAAAERAVAADPIDAGAVSTLGAARLAAGDASGATAAFRVSGGLGWRDRPTQLYWLAVGLELGDFEVAAMRLDALLRQQPPLPQAAQLLARLESHAEGRRALAARLAARPPWFGGWLSPAGLDGGQLAHRAAVLGEPALRSAKIDCATVAPLIDALQAHDRAVEAQRLSASRCGGSHGGLLADGGFETAQLAAASPLGWQFVGEGGLDVRLARAPDGRGRSLAVESGLSFRRVFAYQAVRLAPGRYRIAWRASAPRILVRLTCQRDTGEFLAARALRGGRYETSAEAPANCPATWLELAIEPGAGPAIIDDVALARAG